MDKKDRSRRTRIETLKGFGDGAWKVIIRKIDPGEQGLRPFITATLISANIFVIRKIDPGEQGLRRHPGNWR